jgi:hypothetical protein
VTSCEIVAPQRDGEADDGEPGYNDCPRLGTKPLEPLCVELDRAEDCRSGNHPTAVGARRPNPNGDDNNRPADPLFFDVMAGASLKRAFAGGGNGAIDGAAAAEGLKRGKQSKNSVTLPLR